MKTIHLFIALLAIVLAAVISINSLVPGLLLLTLVACLLNKPRARCCAVTLSVPEILNKVLEAFKVATPALFDFALDFSSKTACLGDSITAKIALVPTTAAYDPTPGVGFYGGVQEVTEIMTDIPVTLNHLDHVPIRIKSLTQLASKVDLFQLAIHDYAHALGKKIVDTVLTAGISNLSNVIQTFPAATNLDWFDGDLRNQLNSQKAAQAGRFCYLNATLAGCLGVDDRVRSALEFSQRNGETGYRTWKNIAGFQRIREYVDFPSGGVGAAGVAGDKRAFAVAVRSIEDASKVADELGVPKVMDFHTVNDAESGLSLTGISWQERGTGDVVVSIAALWGFLVGNDGGLPGSGTDNAACIIKQLP